MSSTDLCTWPISYASCSECAPLDALDPAEKAVFEQMASDYLWNWTGRVYGTCPVEVRPCRADCSYGSTFWGSGPYPFEGSGGWYPTIINGAWTNVRCGSCRASTCECGSTNALDLPGPVASITSVVIDGVTLDPAAYRVDNFHLLVRVDGGSWPTCQDLDAEPTQANTFLVQYERGMDVPLGGQMAAGVLACELAKASCRDASCALPQRIQSITRQGVTIAVLDGFDDIDSGHTGIWVIDSWVASIVKPKRAANVYSVDVPRPRNRVKTWP